MHRMQVCFATEMEAFMAPPLTDRYGGVVFKVNPTGKETLLHDFTTIAGGYLPYAGLFRDRNGSLYGTTTYGGDVGCGAGGGCGLVFKLTACTTPFCQGGGD